MRRAILFWLAVVLVIAAPHFIKQTVPFAPVTGTSMAPAFNEGDLLTYEKASPSEIKVGDVIVYSIPSLIQELYDCPPVVAHRVVEIRGAALGLYYRTRGDNNPAQDPWSVQYGDVIGKVSRRISYLGFPLLFLKSPTGQILIVIMFLASAFCFYANELSQIRHILKDNQSISPVHS